MKNNYYFYFFLIVLYHIYSRQFILFSMPITEGISNVRSCVLLLFINISISSFYPSSKKLDWLISKLYINFRIRPLHPLWLIQLLRPRVNRGYPDPPGSRRLRRRTYWRSGRGKYYLLSMVSQSSFVPGPLAVLFSIYKKENRIRLVWPLKETVSEISSDPLCKAGNARFTFRSKSLSNRYCTFVSRI